VRGKGERGRASERERVRITEKIERDSLREGERKWEGGRGRERRG
jgi:hypothetical protein